MDKLSEVNKNKIIEWCKTDGISFKEIMQKEDSGFLWELSIGDSTPIALYSQKKFPDRINFQKDINLGKELEQMVNVDWEKGKKTNLIISLQTNAVTWDIYQTILGGENITGVRQYLIHSGSS